MNFKESKVTTFMGGTFTLEGIETPKRLASELRDIAEELEGWGDDMISEVALEGKSLHVTLTQGIAGIDP